jgi:hypothetical protein
MRWIELNVHVSTEPRTRRFYYYITPAGAKRLPAPPGQRANQARRKAGACPLARARLHPCSLEALERAGQSATHETKDDMYAEIYTLFRCGDNDRPPPTAVQPYTPKQPYSLTTLQSYSPTALHPYSPVAQTPYSHIALQPCSPDTLQSYTPAPLHPWQPCS